MVRAHAPSIPQAAVLTTLSLPISFFRFFPFFFFLSSAYDKHYDNSGMEDTRKVTILYYMNDWRPEMAGQFRIYQPGSLESPSQQEGGSSSTQRSESAIQTTDVDPIGNRMLVFWSDRLVHSVQASVAPNGMVDHRYAITLWLTSITPDAIVRDDVQVIAHFGSL